MHLKSFLQQNRTLFHWITGMSLSLSTTTNTYLSVRTEPSSKIYWIFLSCHEQLKREMEERQKSKLVHSEEIDVLHLNLTYLFCVTLVYVLKSLTKN